MASEAEARGLPTWVTGAEARFLTGASADELRAGVVSGRVAMYRPFGQGHRVAFLRTDDLLAARTSTPSGLDDRSGRGADAQIRSR